MSSTGAGGRYRRKHRRRKDKKMTDNDNGVRELLRDTVTAWTAHDADGFAALYAKDATVTLANGTYLRGRDEIRAYMAAGFEGRLKGTSGMDEVESIRLIGADAAVAISRSGFTPPAGNVRRATWTLVRQEGAWRVAAYANCPLD
jgi:uncharacterized protein (TIGR02246 family)